MMMETNQNVRVQQ